MGFDPEKIPIVSRAFQCRDFPLSEHGLRDVIVRSNVASWNHPLPEISSDDTFHFEPHFGWKGHIEHARAGVLSELQPVEAGRQS
jgi:hypothetical protein